MRVVKRLILWFLIIIRLPWTIARMVKAYQYAKWIDRRMSGDGDVALSLQTGETIYYKRGTGLTVLKFIGAFNDRR